MLRPEGGSAAGTRERVSSAWVPLAVFGLLAAVSGAHAQGGPCSESGGCGAKSHGSCSNMQCQGGTGTCGGGSPACSGTCTGTCDCATNWHGANCDAKKSCALKPAPKNADWKGGGPCSASYGEKCTAVCRAGWDGGPKQEDFKCEDGVYTGSLECTRVSCPAFQPDASVDAGSCSKAGQFEDTCELDCQPGYKQDSTKGSNQYSCNQRRKWEPTNGPFSCSGKECDQTTLPPDPPLTRTGDPKDINGYRYPSVVTLQCASSEHPSGPNMWECSNTTLQYTPADGTPMRAGELHCDSCTQIANCPVNKLACAPYEGKCTNWKWPKALGVCKPHGRKVCYEQHCTQCAEAHAVVAGASPAPNGPCTHPIDTCFEFVSLRPAECSQAKCVQARYQYTSRDDTDTCRAAGKGCQLAVDGAHNSFKLNLAESWKDKTVKISVERQCQKSHPDSPFYWQRYEWCSSPGTLGDDRVSIILPWDRSKEGVVTGGAWVEFSTTAPSGTIDLNFTRPGLFSLTVNVDGKDHVVSEQHLLDVGPGIVSGQRSTSAAGFTLHHDFSTDQPVTVPVPVGENKIQYWTGSGNRSIRLTDWNFQENFEPVLSVNASARDSQGNPRLGFDEMRIEIAALDADRDRSITLAVWATDRLRRNKGKESAWKLLQYGNNKTGSYYNSDKLLRSGILTLSIWVCARDNMVACSNADALLGGKALEFTVCPQNTVFANSAALQNNSAAWYNQVIQGRHLEDCKCMPGFSSEEGFGTTCKACESGRHGIPELGGTSCDGCDAGRYCGCASQTAQVNRDDCDDKDWDAACTGTDGQCEVCKRDTYQNLQSQTRCWTCYTGGFQCFKGSTYPIAKPGFWVSPSLASSVSNDETLDCTLHGEGTPTDPCRKCSGLFISEACPGSTLDKNGNEPRIFDMSKKPEQKRCFMQPAPDNHGTQSFLHTDTHCQAVIGAKLKHGYKFSATSTGSQVPAACCRKSDRETSCQEEGLPAVTYYSKASDQKSATGGSQRECSSCNNDDSSALWNTVQNLLGLYSWWIFFSFLGLCVCLYKIADYIRYMMDVKVLLIILTSFTQTYNLIEKLVGKGSSSTDSNVFPDGLLPVCGSDFSTSSDYNVFERLRCYLSHGFTAYLAPLANFDVARTLKALGAEQLECQFDIPYDLYYYAVMISPVLIPIILVIPILLILLVSASAQYIEKQLEWQKDADGTCTKPYYKKGKDSKPPELASEWNQNVLHRLEFSCPRLGACCAALMCIPVVIPLLACRWGLYLLTLGGGEWSETTFCKRLLQDLWCHKLFHPQRPGQAVASLMLGLWAGILAKTALHWSPWSTGITSTLVFVLSCYLVWNEFLSLRPPGRGFGAESCLTIFASFNAESMYYTTRDLVIGYMGSVGYIFIMQWAVAPLFCNDSGFMQTEPTVECSRCTNENGLEWSYPSLKVAATFFSLMYGIGLPAFFFIKISVAQQTGRIRSQNFQGTYGFLTAKMKDQWPCYAWGVWSLIRKLMLVLGTVFFAEHLATFLLFTLVVLLVSLCGQMLYMPFAEVDANSMETMTLFTLILVIGAAIGRLTSPPKLYSNNTIHYDRDDEGNIKYDALDKFIDWCAYIKAGTLFFSAVFILGRITRGMWKRDRLKHRHREDAPSATALHPGAHTEDANPRNFPTGGVGLTRPVSPEPEPEPEPQSDAALPLQPFELDLLDKSKTSIAKTWTEIQDNSVRRQRHHDTLHAFQKFSTEFEGISGETQETGDGDAPGARWHDNVLYEELLEFESYFKPELRPVLHVWANTLPQDERAKLNEFVHDLLWAEEQQRMYCARNCHAACYSCCRLRCCPQGVVRRHLQCLQGISRSDYIPRKLGRWLTMLHTQMEDNISNDESENVGSSRDSLNPGGRCRPSRSVRGLDRKVENSTSKRLYQAEEPKLCGCVPAKWAYGCIALLLLLSAGVISLLRYDEPCCTNSECEIGRSGKYCTVACNITDVHAEEIGELQFKCNGAQWEPVNPDMNCGK